MTGTANGSLSAEDSPLRRATATGAPAAAGAPAKVIAQRTLASETDAVVGIGLHSGREGRLTLRPAPPDAGIVFHRADLGGCASVRACAANVVDTARATTLGEGGVRVATIEHLMAALAGVGIDNAHIDVCGPELPIMDGSAAPFVALIDAAGIAEQDAPKRFLRVTREVTCTDGCAVATLRPHDGFRVEYTMDYDHPFFASQCMHAAVEVSAAAFARDVSRARTFGFLADMEALRAADLVRGGSLDNAIVVGDDGIVNEDGLRYEDEFVKHKILDAIGDLYVCGHAVLGAFAGHRSGHGTNHALLRTLLDDPSAYETVTRTH